MRGSDAYFRVPNKRDDVISETIAFFALNTKQDDGNNRDNGHNLAFFNKRDDGLLIDHTLIKETMVFLSIIFKWDDGFVPKRWVFGELKAKHNVTIIRHSKVLTEFWAYGFHYYSPACFWSLQLSLNTHCSPRIGRHYGEIFPDPSDRRQRRRPGEPDHLIAKDHLDHRSWPSLEGPTSTDGYVDPSPFGIMLLLCVSQKLSTFIDISVSLHRRFQINRTFQI